jgi:hypothetical protein
MNRGAAVKETEVFDVANALRASKQRVTVQAVREKLGRGSLTTMCKYLAKWNRQEPHECSDDGNHLIPEFVQQEFEKIWRDTRSKLELCDQAVPESKQRSSDTRFFAKDPQARIAVDFLARKVVELEKKNTQLELLLKRERLAATMRNCFSK